LNRATSGAATVVFDWGPASPDASALSNGGLFIEFGCGGLSLGSIVGFRLLSLVLCLLFPWRRRAGAPYPLQKQDTVVKFFNAVHAKSKLSCLWRLIRPCGALVLGLWAGGAIGAEIAADFTLPVHGTNQTASLYSHVGKVIVLEFWYGSCPVCQAAAPDVRANVRDYFNARGGNTDGLPVKLIYVNVYNGDNSEDWFIQTYGLDYVLDDYAQTVFRQFGNGTPTFVVINGVTNSSTHQPWEVVYKRVGYDSGTTTAIRNAVNAVRRSPGSGQAPVITREPADQSLPAGNPASFSVTATGSGPLTYQWYFKGEPLIPSGQSATLRLPKVSTANAGEYYVIVSNPFGQAASRVARLTVLRETVPPKLTITSPASGRSTTNAAVLLQGTATDNDQVVQVLYSLNAGPVQIASGSNTWSAWLELVPGTNRVRAWCLDAWGNSSATQTWWTEYVVYSPWYLTINPPSGGRVTGLATNKPLMLNRTYRLTATPAPGFVFSNWTGQVSGTNPTLSFVMQSNLVVQANFVPNPFIPLRGNWAGLFEPTNTVLTASNCGAIRLTLANSGAFSGQLRLPGGTVPFSGQFGLELRAHTQAKVGKNRVLKLELGLDPAGRMQGQITEEGAWVGAVEGFRTGSPTNLSLPGRFTMVLPAEGVMGAGDGGAELPGGDGGLTLQVSRSGQASLSGQLGDATAVTASADAAPEGWLPVFLPLYRGSGTVLGWVQLPAGGVSTNEPLVWFKARQSSGTGLYPEGFDARLTAWLGRYVGPSGWTNALGWTNGCAWLSGGNLTNQVHQALRVERNQVKVTPPNPLNLSVSLTPGTGLFSGSFKDPATGRSRSVRGVLFQPTVTGYGVFAGTNSAGLIRLVPDQPDGGCCVQEGCPVPTQ